MRPMSRRIDVRRGFIIPPLGDAHTHHSDGPHTLEWQRSSFLESGVFYAMTMTAEQGR